MPPETNYRPTTFNDTLQQLDAAQRNGVRVFRYFASLDGPNQIAWLKNTTLYWQRYDRLLDDIEKRGLYAIASLGNSNYKLSNAYYNVNETRTDLVMDRQSKAYELTARWFSEFATRYKHRKGLLMYELGEWAPLVSHSSLI